MSEPSVTSLALAEHFAALEDPRVERTKLHPLVSVMIPNMGRCESAPGRACTRSSKPMRRSAPANPAPSCVAPSSSSRSANSRARPLSRGHSGSSGSAPRAAAQAGRSLGLAGRRCLHPIAFGPPLGSGPTLALGAALGTGSAHALPGSPGLFVGSATPDSPGQWTETLWPISRATKRPSLPARSPASGAQKGSLISTISSPEQSRGALLCCPLASSWLKRKLGGA